MKLPKHITVICLILYIFAISHIVSTGKFGILSLVCIASPICLSLFHAVFYVMNESLKDFFRILHQKKHRI